MYVTEDEAERLARETVQQLADIEHSFATVDEPDNSTGIVINGENDTNDLNLELLEEDSLEVDGNSQYPTGLSESSQSKENGPNSYKESNEVENDAKNDKGNNPLFSIFDKNRKTSGRVDERKQEHKNAKKAHTITTQVTFSTQYDFTV